MLRQIRALHQSYWPAMAVRIKVMSGMNIAETRAPQDGRITLDNIRPADRFPRRQPADHPRRNIVLHPRPPEGHRSLEGLGLTEDHLTS